MIEVTNDGRVRIITLQRPEAKNAMSIAMWDGAAEAFLDAQDDPSVAVVVLTGSGDSFSAGQDVIEMGRMAMGEKLEAKHGFPGLTRILIDFPKPLVLAVNGMGLGFGATILGVADLVFMSIERPPEVPVHDARRRPRAGQQRHVPGPHRPPERHLGADRAPSGSAPTSARRWASPTRCASPTNSSTSPMEHARTLASRPISSLMACKRTIVDPMPAPPARGPRARERRVRRPHGRPRQHRGDDRFRREARPRTSTDID